MPFILTPDNVERIRTIAREAGEKKMTELGLQKYPSGGKGEEKRSAYWEDVTNSYGSFPSICHALAELFRVGNATAIEELQGVLRRDAEGEKKPSITSETVALVQEIHDTYEIKGQTEAGLKKWQADPRNGQFGYYEANKLIKNAVSAVAASAVIAYLEKLPGWEWEHTKTKEGGRAP